MSKQNPQASAQATKAPKASRAPKAKATGKPAAGKGARKSVQGPNFQMGLGAEAGVQARVAEAAQKVGVTAASVDQVQLDIDRMRQLGILVDISVHGLSMFSVQASWEELGVPEGDLRRKKFTAGRKGLIPFKYISKLRSLDTRFRASLDRHSRVVEGFRPYRWIPFTAYESWKQEWTSLKAEWDATRAEILAHYWEFKDQAAAEMADIAREAWAAIVGSYRARHGKLPKDGLQMKGTTQAFRTVEEFVDYIVARRDRMPAIEEIENGLYVDYRTALITTGADLAAEQARREKARAETAGAQAEQRVAQAKVDEARAEAWRKEQLARQAVEEADAQKLARIRAMHEAEQEHVREQLGRIVSPLQEVFDQLRAQIYGEVEDIVASISKNGYVRGNVADRIRNLQDVFSLFNAHGDDDLGRQLAALTTRFKVQAPTLPTDVKVTCPRCKAENALKASACSGCGGDLRAVSAAAVAALLGEAPSKDGQGKQGKAQAKRADSAGKYDTAQVLASLQTIADMTRASAERLARELATPTRAGALEFDFDLMPDADAAADTGGQATARV